MYAHAAASVAHGPPDRTIAGRHQPKKVGWPLWPARSDGPASATALVRRLAPSGPSNRTARGRDRLIHWLAVRAVRSNGPRARSPASGGRLSGPSDRTACGCATAASLRQSAIEAVRSDGPNGRDRPLDRTNARAARLIQRPRGTGLATSSSARPAGRPECRRIPRTGPTDRDGATSNPARDPASTSSA